MLAELESQWCQHFLKGRHRRWQVRPLVTRIVALGICATQLEARQCLEELDRAEMLEVAQGVSLSPLLQLNPRIGLAEQRCVQLAESLPVANPDLALTPQQTACWNRALAGGLDGWSLVDQHRLVAGLRALSRALPEGYRLSRYAASARYLLASSKLLDRLPNDLLHAFDIEPKLFCQPDAWLLASMPKAPDSVLLIENPQSYMQAMRVGLDRRIALICSFGYGLSLGEALAGVERVRLVGECELPLTLSELLALPHLTYWGDLDPEGLRIFRRLAGRLPHLRMSALYAPMIDTLERSGGHPLHKVTGKAGQSAGVGWARGVDQECLDDATLQTLAGVPLDSQRQRRWLGYIEPSGGT
nr:Wadjet anti-phage system protein JetD domain-containing protein [Halomonas socia]